MSKREYDEPCSSRQADKKLKLDQGIAEKAIADKAIAGKPLNEKLVPDKAVPDKAAAGKTKNEKVIDEKSQADKGSLKKKFEGTEPMTVPFKKMIFYQNVVEELQKKPSLYTIELIIRTCQKYCQLFGVSTVPSVDGNETSSVNSTHSTSKSSYEDPPLVKPNIENNQPIELINMGGGSSSSSSKYTKEKMDKLIADLGPTEIIGKNMEEDEGVDKDEAENTEEPAEPDPSVYSDAAIRISLNSMVQDIENAKGDRVVDKEDADVILQALLEYLIKTTDSSIYTPFMLNVMFLFNWTVKDMLTEKEAK